MNFVLYFDNSVKKRKLLFFSLNQIAYGFEHNMAKTRDYAEWAAQIDKDSGTINVFGLSLQTIKKKVSIPPAYMNSMRLAVEKMLTHELYK